MAKYSEAGNVNAPDNSSSKDGDAASQANQNKARPGTTASDGAKTDKSNFAARKVSEIRGQYLIAARRSQGLQAMGQQPLSFSLIEQTLRALPDIEVVDTVGPKSIMGALASGMNDAPTVLVAKMTEQNAHLLHQQAQGRLVVERDQHLSVLEPTFQQPSLVTTPAAVSGPALKTTVTVVGADRVPVKGAEVYLFGCLVPGSGVTDERGQVTLSLFGETPQSIRSLYIKPRADYWSFYQPHPNLSTDEANVIALRPISDMQSLANFPQKQAYGWGQKAMRLDQLPENYRGQGVKIAIIDSGVATSHDDLRNIRFGIDVINRKTNANSWNEDYIGHGTHSAGLIAGAQSESGIRGFAPDAEIHVCRLFPGGQISQLIEALEYCIEQQIDVVNLSLGGIAPSEILEQQILHAKHSGVACIVAAGNAGASVQYPASSPNVLTVSAIGRLNEFPSDSYHVQTVTPLVDGNGFFSARFTCFGPEVDVCAPGVAIVSAIPPNNYAVLDGTSTAAPHVTGLAALVLAHHPEFQAIAKIRNAERVDRLFQMIKLSARGINLGDPTRIGFGLPDALVAVGLQPPARGMSLEAQAAARAFEQGVPQIWYGNPWGQFGASMGASNLMDQTGWPSAFTAHLQPISTQGLQFGDAPFGYGVSPAAIFGRSGW